MTNVYYGCLLRTDPPPPTNDVMNTKPLLAYSSQNLASRGCKKCLDTLKIEPTRGRDKMSTTHHPPKSTPKPASISSKWPFRLNHWTT